MKPFLEKVPAVESMSWSMLNRRLDDAIPFQWHHHPEFELTLTLNSRGQHFIGDHIGAYDDGDLVLVGPNLPHTWSSTAKVDEGLPHVALVLWFSQQWVEHLCANFIEFQAIAALFARGSRALKFSSALSDTVRPAIEALFNAPPEERLIGVIDVLRILARDEAARPLTSVAAAPETAAGDRSRIDRVLDHIHLNYAEQLAMAELADVAALSLSGLHRLFQRHTGATISAYLQGLRLGDACARLSGSAAPIAHIAEAAGYRSLANFNRQFRAAKSMTPREYRNRFAARR